MKINIQADTKIRVIISIVELFIRFICIQKIMISNGIQITTHELRKNLHLMTACLSSHLIVSQKFENVSVILFVTASHAE